MMNKLFLIALLILPAFVNAADSLVERGDYLTSIMLCKGCHTAPGDDYQWQYDNPQYLLAGGMKIDFPPFGVFYTKNITPDMKTGIGGWSDEEIERAIRHGISRDGRGLRVMPYAAFAHLSADDMKAVISYLREVPAIRHVVPPNEEVSLWRKMATGLKLIAPFVENPSQDWYYGDFGRFEENAEKPRETFKPQGEPKLLPVPSLEHADELISRGRYLATISLCVGCHTPVGAGGTKMDLLMAGGFEVQDPSCGTIYSSNLTPDEKTGIGSWTNAELADAIRKGISPSGRKLCDIVMPSSLYAGMSDSDIQAIAAYLRSLPAINNEVPVFRASGTPIVNAQRFVLGNAGAPALEEGEFYFD